MLAVVESLARGAGMALLCSSALLLASCSDSPFDSATQIGPNPNLPEPRQYLFPSVHIASIIGWKNGETPSVPQGLKIEALATGLEHPRSLYVLPNGDVLVVESKSPGAESIRRPKDLVMHWIESQATSGGGNQKSNRITLLGGGNGDGAPETRSVLLDNLNSPFGVALVGSDLYVANTDAIVRYPYNAGDTRITAAGTILTALPGGPIDHHHRKPLVQAERL